ncbi:MAG TPA: HEPN domain-containing protein [Solirubrobacteraceae bacterium]
MTEAMEPLERGREELRAARALLDTGFPSQALTRAYFAGFHAAAAALMTTGESPPTEAGVLAAFSRRASSNGHFAADDARALRKLFEDRNDVDYALAEAPVHEAQQAVDAAEQLVASVSRFVGSPR